MFALRLNQLNQYGIHGDNECVNKKNYAICTIVTFKDSNVLDFQLDPTAQ